MKTFEINKKAILKLDEFKNLESISTSIYWDEKFSNKLINRQSEKHNKFINYYTIVLLLVVINSSLILLSLIKVPIKNTHNRNLEIVSNELLISSK